MTVQGHGTGVWRLKGRAKMTAEVSLTAASDLLDNVSTCETF